MTGSTQPIPSCQAGSYQWGSYRCAYDYYPGSGSLNLLLIPPIGVGLSRQFWDRFCQVWFQSGQPHSIYNIDLLGCGESDKPRAAYQPSDWAEQLNALIETVIQKPVVVVVQGASLPIALELIQHSGAHWIRGLVMGGPPPWSLMTEALPAWQQRVIWNILDSPAGLAFYQYARRRSFLQSFSVRQLFEREADVDQYWLDTLQAGSEDLATRHAVFAFLAGFWRQGYGEILGSWDKPTLVAMGTAASSISRSGPEQGPERRITAYLNTLKHGEAVRVKGRNVLPYESPVEFVSAMSPFIRSLAENPIDSQVETPSEDSQPESETDPSGAIE